MASQQVGTNKAIVLAAGYGSRLSPLTLETPKPLLEMAGRPLITYALDALASNGISDIGVVVGYQSEKIQEVLEREYPNVTFIYNDAYDGGNGLSVYSARSFVSDSPFMVCMADHLISPKIVGRLLSEASDGGILCVDTEATHPSQTDDVTRVATDHGGNIVGIGKELKAWDAIDTGVFRMTADVFPAIERLVFSNGLDVSISNVVTRFGEDGRPFSTCDVSGAFWADIDTLWDYQSLDRLMRDGYGL